LFSPSTTMPPANLKPQETNSYEIGANVKLFKSRVGIDLTYYDQKTSNQILNVATSTATG
ncbi:MAG TPA: TonB-dependent receptor, partial [Chitinophagaceae bacterium]|nr:TonB-dependent receptor [Chitinophagaceae bacterium]